MRVPLLHRALQCTTWTQMCMWLWSTSLLPSAIRLRCEFVSPEIQFKLMNFNVRWPQTHHPTALDAALRAVASIMMPHPPTGPRRWGTCGACDGAENALSTDEAIH